MKKIGMYLLAGAAAVILSACGSSQEEAAASSGVVDTQADKGLEVMGDQVVYDPNHLVNDGQPVSLDWWIWTSEDTFTAIAEEYEKIHPNVSIRVVYNPWDGYFTKLPLSLQKKEDGPALFNIHNSYDSLLADYGLSTGMVYYNKRLWEEAGLTEEDIPKTWDELIEVGKKLTRFDEEGNIVQAGFNYNKYFNVLAMGLNYQFGENMFTADGKEARVDSPGMKEAVGLLKDLYDVHRIGDKDFGTDSEQSFYQEQSAMVFMWGFLVGNLKTNYPNLEYGTFEIPTVSEEVPYAYYRYNGESTPGINKNASPAQKEAAQDFIRFFLANDAVQIRLSQEGGLIPAKSALMEAPELKDTPLVKAAGPHIDRYIWPGAMPATLETNLKIAGEDILYNGKDMEKALKTANDIINVDLANQDFTASENLYAFYKSE